MNQYAKPGPKDPIVVGMLRSCDFCESMVHVDRRQRHIDWHRMNGLHAPDCVLVLSNNISAQVDDRPALRNCTCGLVPRSGVRFLGGIDYGTPERPALPPPTRYEDI